MCEVKVIGSREMKLKFEIVDDKGNKKRDLFDITLSPPQASEFILKTDGGSIVVPEILHECQGYMIVEGADWSNAKRMRLDSKQEGINLIFPVKNIQFGILESYAQELKGGPVTLMDIKFFLEKGIRALLPESNIPDTN
ncbi:hypothetical protein [Acetobacter persici]|uniref:hypothetical protein n=1 Tax=Acetobacter persici TaxID=1076596 RepID=UPI0039E9BFF9